MKSVYKEEKTVSEVDFGKVELNLKEYLDKHGITRNQLSVYTGIKYQTIDRYYKAVDIERVDLTLLAKICFVLECNLSDILRYVHA